MTVQQWISLHLHPRGLAMKEGQYERSVVDHRRLPKLPVQVLQDQHVSALLQVVREQGKTASKLLESMLMSVSQYVRA